jgi:2-polyprenyl-3-methyl-5-hydroxy-6-metoxy-1,4-benzoquinol methylase
MSVVERHRWGSAPEFIGPRHELRERLLLDLFRAAAPGPRVLNAGAGQGTFSFLLERDGFDVTSTDLSADCVDVLRQTLAGPAVEADIADLPFDDGEFDAAVLGEVLEHIEDDAAALREVGRVLKPSGIVAISVPANPHEYGRADEWAGHFRRYSRETLVSLCTAAGLEVETCVGWGFPFTRLYHRHLYERRLERVGTVTPKRWQLPAVWALRMTLQADRLFVGVERGAFGLLLIASRPAEAT